MMIVLLGGYIAILALFVWLGFIPLNRFWKFSPVIVLIALNLGLFIPMGWGAPQGTALVTRNSVSIVPDVVGEVIDVPVQANTPVKAGDVLFRIDPAPFQATVDQYAARLARGQALLEKDRTNLVRYRELTETNSAPRQQAEDQQAIVNQDEDSLKLDEAMLDGAKYNLEKTVVRAPADGYVTNLGLRKGARVTSAPVMAFIDTSDTVVAVEIQQIAARYVEPGQNVEITFKFFPGRVLTGKVVAVLQAISSGQTQLSGTAVTPAGIQAAPFVVRVKLDDENAARSLPAGSTGAAAIYTSHVKVSHIIRKVLLRQVTIMNYINPL
jgi:RND family efflux transporter MFP subunit